MKLALACALISFSLVGMAAVKIEEEVYVVGQNPRVIEDLIRAHSVEIDHVSSQGFEVYGPKGLKGYLDSQNIINFDMSGMNKMVGAEYPTHAQMSAKLQAITSKFPKFMKMVSLGKSHLGKDLWAIKISDNVAVDEVEPEFKYISSMHGDEITGRELMVRLIEEMGEKYGKDREITELIDNTEIYIIPSMNPDGSAAQKRANAQGIDLNRNFPDIVRDRQSDDAGRPAEVRVMMKFQAERKFSLSANFHGGTIVANYPWDSKYDRHPMDAFVQELSLSYADLNPEMRNSTEFSHGITNGADWYIVNGGMQDWSYFWFNDLQITVELSHAKWPNYSDIPGFYRSNRNSLVAYMKKVHLGAGVKFQTPGMSGTVLINKFGSSESVGRYAFSNSEFYKVLPVGDYEFVIETKAGVQKAQVSVGSERIKQNGNYILLN